MYKTIMCLVLLLIYPSVSTADLFSDAQTTAVANYPVYSRSDAATGFAGGAGMVAPYNNIGNVVQLGAGISRGGCGSFDMIASMKSLFNKEAMGNYVKGLEGAIVSEAPLLILCYASQTLCDLYKHYRNMVNAAIALRNAQCQQIEKLAETTGSDMRASSESNCITEQFNAGQDIDTAMASCRNVVDKVGLPTSGGFGAGYSMVDEISKGTGMSPENTAILKAVMGDAYISADTGTGSKSVTPLAYEKLVSAYTAQSNTMLTTIVSNFRQNWQMPAAQDLVEASSPDFPLHPSTLRALALADPNTSAVLIGQLSTLYGLSHTYYQLEEVNSNMAAYSENPNLASKAERERLQRDQVRLQQQLALMEKRMEYQSKYLVPKLQALENSIPTNQGQSFTPQDNFPSIFPMTNGPFAPFPQ